MSTLSLDFYNPMSQYSEETSKGKGSIDRKHTRQSQKPQNPRLCRRGQPRRHLNALPPPRPAPPLRGSLSGLSRHHPAHLGGAWLTQRLLGSWAAPGPARAAKEVVACIPQNQKMNIWRMKTSKHLQLLSAIIGGKILQLIRIPLVPPLPPLLGMLLAGFTIRNVPFINEHVHVPNTWSSILRSIALTIILIRAGLGLDPQALRHLKVVCFRLAVGPCLMEASAAAVFSHFIMKFPWQWAFLLGFVLGAVSPAVVVPYMMVLQENGYGVEEGIPTLLMAASSMDDILAISGFNTCLSIVFSSGGILKSAIASIRNICISLLAGIVLGFFVRYFPSEDQKKLTLKRGFLVLTMCVSAVLGSQRIGLHGSGGLCTLVLSFIAGTKWSQEKMKVQKIITTVWDIFQPLLFGLVGAEVSVSSLESNIVGISVATLSLALCVRILTTYLLMCFAGFSFKEKIFIALAWMPKATVQAVLGPLALETARVSAPHLEPYAKDVMTVAFLAILITAPNGALLMGILGPKMLTRHYDPSKIKLQLSTLEHH
ncbi:sodium/hydrogen exchanger 9B1 isoform X5 [Pan paniscus]|uniref:sodium/hydrogen exchanger 9B1 isoform X5 n=1 Tax=Pan paniscus TaxID=9597 RepID=UPI00156002AA|nr:sodium/hydrogen exchanger 9B1 isoform X5 [Pan paniscus]